METPKEAESGQSPKTEVVTNSIEAFHPTEVGQHTEAGTLEENAEAPYELQVEHLTKENSSEDAASQNLDDFEALLEIPDVHHDEVEKTSSPSSSIDICTTYRIIESESTAVNVFGMHNVVPMKHAAGAGNTPDATTIQAVNAEVPNSSNGDNYSLYHETDAAAITHLCNPYPAPEETFTFQLGNSQRKIAPLPKRCVKSERSNCSLPFQFKAAKTQEAGPLVQKRKAEALDLMVSENGDEDVEESGNSDSDESDIVIICHNEDSAFKGAKRPPLFQKMKKTSPPLCQETDKMNKWRPSCLKKKKR